MGIITAIALPQLPDIIDNYQLRRSVRGLMSQLNQMKLQAVKENARTVILIDEDNDSYTVFLDDDSENWALDDDEEGTVTDLSVMDQEITTTLVSDYTGFNGRGLQARATGGSITITASNGSSQRIVISSIGSFRVESMVN
ncbi:MAG: GspH/FimT family protein [Desulfobacterales bacterium]|nr:GspH/FimT family protein [Desulfobacterales bacterium]